MRNEIKLSVKMAREDDDANAQFPPLINYDGTVTPARKCPRYREAGPTHKPDWHRAPDLAMLKSRPVDPPRERDYAKLTEAAKRKDAPFVDWNGPSSDPTIKHAGALSTKPKRKGETEEDCFTNYDDANAACRADQYVQQMPDGSFAIYEKTARAPVGDSAVAEFEPVGTPWIVGDRVRWLAECGKIQAGQEFTIKRIDGAIGYYGDASWEGMNEWWGEQPCGFRILKRKNVAARAWKENGGKYQWLCIGKRWYSLSPYSGWSDYGDNFLWDNPMTGWSELTAPAEIQRLVAELHAAGLGK